MDSYTNHFGSVAANYLHYRPTYPDVLFEYLSGLVNLHQLAWDCGTGNGQAAVKLAKYFDKVVATDKSQKQLDQAPRKSNVFYYRTREDNLNLADKSVDLITVAQALHWFDLNRFYHEVSRVIKPNGIIAAWCYSLGSLDKQIHQLLKKLYADILGTYWPKERKYIDEEYHTIPFPFKRTLTPKFNIEFDYNLAEFLGYLNTWSAVKEYEKRNQNKNPIDMIYLDLTKAWGDPQTRHHITWPIHLLVGSLS